MAEEDLPRTLAASPVGPPTGSVSPPTDPWPQPEHPTRVEPVAARRLPRWLLAVGTATAVLAVSAFFAVLLWPSGGGTERSQPLEFRPFEPVGQIALGEDVDGIRVRLDGDQVFLAARRGGTAVIVGADRSGEVAWETPVPELDTMNSLTSMSGVVMVLGGAILDSPDDPPRLLVALDAATGQELWRHGHHGNDGWHLAAGVATQADSQTNRLRGFDPVSGDQLWSHHFPDGRTAVRSVLADEDLAGRSRLSSPTHDVPRADGRVVLVGGDRSAEVVDTGDGGTVVDRGPNVADPSDELLAYRDQLFVARADEGGYRVFAYDLTALSAQPQVLYTAPDAQRRPKPGTLVPCGADRVCLVEQGGDETEVISLDTTGQGVAWRAPAPAAEDLLPVGDWLMVGAATPAVVVYDRDGAAVLERPGVAVRLNSGNVLLFASAPGTFRSDLSVAGIALGAAGSGRGSGGAVGSGGAGGSDPPDRIELGQLASVRGDGCFWDEQYLACPTSAGAGIWRFAT